jgi:hypothetical protein
MSPFVRMDYANPLSGDTKSLVSRHGVFDLAVPSHLDAARSGAGYSFTISLVPTSGSGSMLGDPALRGSVAGR